MRHSYGNDVVHKAKRIGDGLLTSCGVSSKQVWQCRYRVSFHRWEPVTCDRCLKHRLYSLEKIRRYPGLPA